MSYLLHSCLRHRRGGDNLTQLIGYETILEEGDLRERLAAHTPDHILLATMSVNLPGGDLIALDGTCLQLTMLSHSCHADLGCSLPRGMLAGRHQRLEYPVTCRSTKVVGKPAS